MIILIKKSLYSPLRFFDLDPVENVGGKEITSDVVVSGIDEEAD